MNEEVRARCDQISELPSRWCSLLQQRHEVSGSSWLELAPLHQGLKVNIAALKKALVRRALAQAEGNKSISDLLGIHRRTQTTTRLSSVLDLDRSPENEFPE